MPGSWLATWCSATPGPSPRSQVITSGWTAPVMSSARSIFLAVCRACPGPDQRDLAILRGSPGAELAAGGGRAPPAAEVAGQRVVVTLGVGAVASSLVPGAAGQVLSVATAALPVSIGVGILKYRLYEIDRIISRTLAYAIVTGLLVGVYAGLALLATQVLRVHIPVAVAAATLAAVALFNPVRQRVQNTVDRRFNRARYDADQTVTAFAARLKNGVNLD